MAATRTSSLRLLQAASSARQAPRVARRGLASASSAALVELGTTHVTKGLSRLTTGLISKGEGSYLHMDDGRKLLDFTTGIGVTVLGHCHPQVSQAAAEQCLNLVHGQCSIAFHRPYLELIEQLLPVMPDKSLDSFFFWNSGSEAVEAAIKMARMLTGRQNIISMQGSYHGRTMGAVSITRTKTVYGEGTLPLMPGSFGTPFPYWHQFGLPPSTSEDELSKMALYQLDLLLKQQSAPRDTAAIIIEPVIGEGGYVPAPPAFLRGLRAVCDKHGILLVVDEVQSGYGRTGKMFAIEHSGVRPDILLVAKGLANGFPLSAVISRRELTDKLLPGSMGGTYAGNAVACAAAIACTKAIKEENILDNVNARAKELFASLASLQADPAIGKHILDVRGQGLMAAVEFASPAGPSAHDPLAVAGAPAGMSARVTKRCLEKGMLLLGCSAYETVRFIPALNISKEDLQKGADIFREAVTEVVREG